MDGVKFEAGELHALVTNLGEAAREVPENVKKALGVTSLKIKRDAQDLASGLAHAPLYPRSITYDVRGRTDDFVADIGPDKNRPQGALGNLLEFGSVNNPPHPHLAPALEHNVDDFERGCAIAVGEILK